MSLLDRIRSFVLAFALLAMVPAGIALAKAPRLPLSRVAGGVALAFIALAWVVSYRRKKLPWWLEALIAVALFVLVNGLSDPRAVQGFFFAVLMFNGLFGGLLQLIARLVLVQGTFFSHGEAAPISAVGFTAAGVVIWSLGRAIERQAQLEAEKNRSAKAERELEIASQIQTSLLPKTVSIVGFELAAAMAPAEDIGGDYYDVFETPDGCIIGIGDVSGHGLVSGLIMLMLQSSISTLVRERPSATPAELLVAVNRVLYDNIHNRLAKTAHVTMTLLKLDRTGKVTYAGAHEELIVQRASGKVEALPTPGTWLGAQADIKHAIVDTTVTLAPSDVLVLHTDGVTEARNSSGELFGMERLVACVEAMHGKTPQQLVAGVNAEITTWTASSQHRDDDVTVLAARFGGA